MEMPVLQPIPIVTKEKHFLIRIWRWISSVRHWSLAEDWYYDLPDQTRIKIPAGFVMDGASVPRPLWGLLSPTGLLLIPGIIHDYAYQHDGLIALDQDQNETPYRAGAGRRFWDQLFLKVATETNDLCGIDYLAYLAIRLGGWLPWRQHRKK